MKKSDSRIFRFFEYADRTCEAAGVDIEVSDSAHVMLGNQKVFAYFAPPQKRDTITLGKISIAGKSGYPELLHKLVHEFAHFTQWSERATVWMVRDFMHERYVEMAARKKKVPTIERAGIRSSIRALELDCEKRAVQIINTWDLPLDVGAYIQYANAHIWWHTLSMLHAPKGLSGRNHPITVSQSVVARCPKEFLDNYDDVPEFFRAACIKNCKPLPT